MKDPLEYITDFEKKIAEYFGAPYAVAVDCCTHALELCFRLENDIALVPRQTVISIPFMLEKIKHPWKFVDNKWEEYYKLTPTIIDAATLWRKNCYIPNTKMCLSFHYRKHLNIDRGGMILLDNKSNAELLSRMAYDGRERNNIPWSEQDITVIGYHYYMTPDKAILGLKKFKGAILKVPKTITYKTYPDLTKKKIFNVR
tara:strand:- start:1213 stop:1812 length:600 start_codon:yes stop_codon:yes gene_type:complete